MAFALSSSGRLLACLSTKGVFKALTRCSPCFGLGFGSHVFSRERSSLSATTCKSWRPGQVTDSSCRHSRRSCFRQDVANIVDTIKKPKQMVWCTFLSPSQRECVGL